MISSAISADLGRQDLVKGSSEALATVTGIVDGTGSIGAAVGQVREREREGWGFFNNYLRTSQGNLSVLTKFPVKTSN